MKSFICLLLLFFSFTTVVQAASINTDTLGCKDKRDFLVINSLMSDTVALHKFSSAVLSTGECQIFLKKSKTQIQVITREGNFIQGRPFGTLDLFWFINIVINQK